MVLKYILAGTEKHTELLEHSPLDGAEVVLAVDHRGGFGEGGVGVLEAMAGEDADDGLRGRRVLDGREAVGEEAGDGGGAGGLAEDAFVVGEPAVGVQDLFVGDGGDAAAGGGKGGHRLLPAGWVADPDRRGDGLRVLDRLAADQRRRALGLEAVENRPYDLILI